MKIPHKILASLLPICDPDADSSRYAMNAIRVEREDPVSAVAVALDGRSLLAVRWGFRVTDCESEAPVYTVPAPLVAAAIDATPIKRKRRRTVGESMRRAQARAAASEVTVDSPRANRLRVQTQTPDGTLTAEGAGVIGRYPDWRDCFVREPSDQAVAVLVNPRRLATLLTTIADAATDEDHETVVLTLTPGDDATITVRADRGDGVQAAGLLATKDCKRVLDWMDWTDWTPVARPGESDRPGNAKEQNHEEHEEHEEK